jgi:hypothetical protein
VTVLVLVSPVLAFPLFAHLEPGRVDLFGAPLAFTRLVL